MRCVYIVKLINIMLSGCFHRQLYVSDVFLVLSDHKTLAKRNWVGHAVLLSHVSGDKKVGSI